MTTAKKREPFILLAYKLLQPCNGSRLSVLGAFILGKIWSIAKDGKDFHCGYAKIAKDLNISRSTVARQMPKITKRDDVTAERTGGKATTYTTTFELEGAYIDVPLWITSPFEWTYWEEGKKEVTETVTLTPSEQLVLALIYSQTKALDKKGKKAYRASPATIAHVLQKAICKRTVKAALLRLAKLKLIEREKIAQNAHGEGLGGYKAPLEKFRALLSARRNAERRAKKAQEKAERQLEAARQKIEEQQKLLQKAKTPQEKAIEAANFKADRERFYSMRRDNAQAQADKYTLAAYERDPKLKQLDIEIRRIKLEHAKAEVFAPSKLADVAERQKRLEAERAAILSRFGLEAERFDVEYWTTCKLCKDKGTLPSGAPCGCWNR